MKRNALVSFLVAAAVAGLWLSRTRDARPRSRDASPAERSYNPSNSSALAASAQPLPTAFPKSTAELPASLRGTEVDGWLTVVDGRFVPDRHAIRLFEYFLSTYGEVDFEQIARMVREEALRRVPAAQVPAVMEIFDRYLRLRERATALGRGSPAGSYLADLQRLQRELFGGDAAAIFGQGNRLVKHAISRHEVMADAELSEAERTERLRALDAELPAELRSARHQMGRHQEVGQVVAQMRRDGLSEAEVFDYRADEFGEDAARRLAMLDADRAEWRRRLDVYRAARDSVLARGLGSTDEAEALERLRKEHFDAREVVRIRGMDATAH